MGNFDGESFNLRKSKLVKYLTRKLTAGREDLSNLGQLTREVLADLAASPVKINSSNFMRAYLDTLGVNKAINFNLIPNSFSAIKPGDLIYFDYPEDGTFIDDGAPDGGYYVRRIEPIYSLDSLSMVVSTSRAPTGGFISTQYRPLVTAFKVSTLSTNVFKTLITFTQDNFNAADYETFKDVFEKLTGDRFRTYNLRLMRGLGKLVIDENVLNRYRDELRDLARED